MSPQQENAQYYEIHYVIAYRPLSSISPQQRNALHHEKEDVIVYQPWLSPEQENAVTC